MKEWRRFWILIGLLPVLLCGLFVVLAVLVAPMLGGRALDAPLGFGNTVAIVYVEGPIVMGPASGSQAAYAETIVENLEAALSSGSVKAIVLRIESPGGSVVASREIYDAILEARGKGRPVIASMGEVAASGGYYIAAGADKIYAEPATLTGSIGVISVLPNVSGLVDKVGVEMTVIKSGPHKDSSYGLRDLTEEERAVWQRLIDEAYEDFVSVVATGRRMDIAKVRALADGRIYTGKQAKENGLADEIGDLDAAVQAAARAANIQGEPDIVKFRRAPGLFDGLLFSLLPATGQRDLIDLFSMRQWGRVMYLYLAP